MPIVKWLARHSPTAIAHAVNYVLKEGKNEISEEDLIAPILHNLRSKPEDTEGIIKEIIQNEVYRKVTANRVYCFHEIISLSSYDHPNATPEKLKAILKHYLKLRGDTVSFGVMHFDKGSYHAHVISGATRYRLNKSSGLRKAEMQKLKVELEKYTQEQFPELKNSQLEHGKGGIYQSNAEYQIQKAGRSILKELTDLVKDCYNKAESRIHFVELLALEGYLHYERTQGVFTGIVDPETGKKYRFKRLGVSSQEMEELDNSLEQQRRNKLLSTLNSIRKEQGLDQEPEQ